LLLAVETIPDIFRTVGNVSADMVVTAAASRGADDSDGDAPSEPTPAVST
jgi:Na+/H+-dicarboxylate symporter